jgi:hypothetical protein
MSEQAQEMLHTETGAFNNRFTTKNLGMGHDTTHRVNLQG